MQTLNPDFRQAVQRLFDEAEFIQRLGIELFDCGPGWCETRLVVRKDHFQQDGVIHAAVEATMADHTAGSAATTLIAAGEIVLTAEYKINLLRATAPMELRCRAKVIRAGRRLVFAESDVWDPVDGPELLVAKAIITVAILNKRT